MTTTDLLAHCRDRGVVLTAEGGRLRCGGPAGELTDDLLAAVKAQKPALLALLEGGHPPRPTGEWPADVTALIGWFETAALPPVPFVLHQGVRVVDGERFRPSLQVDIAQGPRGCRARSGALRKHLAALRRLAAQSAINTPARG